MEEPVARQTVRFEMLVIPDLIKDKFRTKAEQGCLTTNVRHVCIGFTKLSHYK